MLLGRGHRAVWWQVPSNDEAWDLVERGWPACGDAPFDTREGIQQQHSQPEARCVPHDAASVRRRCERLCHASEGEDDKNLQRESPESIALKEEGG